jgi:outer membrane receptor protein involved in Fe transport
LQGFFNLSEYEFSEQTNLSGLPETTINKSYLSVDLDSYHTIGRTNIYSGYALLDYTIVPRLRASAGARIEYTNIYADVFKFDSIGYEAFDERRFQPGDAFMVNPGVINQANLLPSLNVIYKLRNKETSPINLRVNYSKTIARPSVRELTETTIFDYEYRNFIFGNADLKTVDIHNYDLRLESYFENGDNISVSFFYKKFFNHIELVQTTQGFSWQNANESDVKGIELDGRKIIMKGLEFRANLTLAQSITEVIQNNIYVKNNIKVVEPFDTLTRQMSGQAPYVINGIISYTMDSLRLSTSIAYNVQGPRLAVVSSQPGFVPDVFELPRHMLDFRIAKELGKRFAVTLTIKDILNSPVRRSYQLPEGFTADFDRYRFGTNYNLSISYKL